MERGARYRGRYLMAALVIALVAGLGAALPVLAQDERGTVSAQVVGGDPVPDGKYPFMTSIQADTGKRSPYQEHFCGGTLIDEDSVLTAAHCAAFIGRKTSATTLDYRKVRLDVGVTVLNSDQGQRRRISSLSDVRIHPDYHGSRNSKYDAAVINLNKPVNGIEPIALATPDLGDSLESPPGTATVAGWGDTEQQLPKNPSPSTFPKRMQEADPPLVSDADCKAAYDKKDDKDPTLTVYPSLMVCAGEGGVDTCQGDSGGPMFVGDTPETRRQIGITSYGLGCAAPRYPGVYTEVNAESIHSFIVRAASR